MKVHALILGVSSLAMAASAQDFVPPTNSICDFIAEHVGSDTEIAPNTRFDDLLVTAAVVDLDDDGDLEVLSRKASLGTARGYNLIWQGLADEVEYSAFEENSAAFEDYVRWGYDGRWLFFKNSWYGLVYKLENLNQITGAYEMTPRGPIVACGFELEQKEEVEWLTPMPASPGICEAVSQSKSGAPDTNFSALTKAEIAYVMTHINDGAFKKNEHDELTNLDAWISMAESVNTLDFDNDGVNDRLVKIDLNSSAGRTCSATFYELLPEAGSLVVSDAKRDALLRAQGASSQWRRYPIDCNTNVEWLQDRHGDWHVHVDNKPWASRSHQRSVIRINPDVSQLQVCRSKFTSHHKVAFDRSKPLD